MSRILEIFKIRPGEERMFALLVGLMWFTAAGSSIGGTAIKALFIDRFGAALLPTMYIILGLFTFVTSLTVTALMGRIAKQRLYVALPFVLGFTLVGEWLVIPLNLKWFFALMWLGMNVINSLQGLLTWGLAGAVCDTRQAKRLFPLFSAGGILGAVLGGLITQPLAKWLHAENLLLFWAAALFISFFLGRALTGSIPAGPAPSHNRQPSIIAEMTRGYQFVRRSSIMQWISYSAILFAICFRSLELPFLRGATAQFPNADQLAGFFGLFDSLTTIAALLASLFLANRLFAHFGILPMLLVYPVIYLAGFGILAVAAPFGLLVTVRFTQLAYMSGIAETSWQALFNVVPPEQRDQVRAFVSGVPDQAGTFIAGLILFFGEQALQPQQLYLIGFTAAALLVALIWRASRTYRSASVEALRAGQPQMFFSEEQPYGGMRTDAAAVSVAIQGVSDPDLSIRRLAAEILGHLPVPETTAVLVKALFDEDALVRVAALKGLARARTASALFEITASLSDPEPEVRYQAIEALRQLAVSPRGIVAHLEPLLSDSDSLVRAQAALALLCAAEHAGARKTLHVMAIDANPLVRAKAVEALGDCGDETGLDLVISALDDIQPVVRKAASGALVNLDPQRALKPLVQHLNEDDTFVRRCLGEAFGKIGEPALEPLVEALSNPAYEDGALIALEHLPVQEAIVKIRAHAKAAAKTALHYHDLVQGMTRIFGREAGGDGRIQLLMESLQDKAQRSGLNALRALGLVTAREAVTVAVENLRSREAAQRANALETLESTGEREIVRPLLALWEVGEPSTTLLPEGWLMDLLDDPYAWLRACAVLVAAKIGNGNLNEKLRMMSQTDPDDIVRMTAENMLIGEPAMEPFATLSLMERILFLRRVPLFADLPPADLKQVAAIAREIVFTDGQTLARQGEPGMEMYIVVSGEVRVLMTTESQKEASEVARRCMGDYVGEMSIISQEPRIATLIAEGSVRALSISQRQFEGILRERPEISLAVMRTLCQRLKEASERTAIQR